MCLLHTGLRTGLYIYNLANLIADCPVFGGMPDERCILGYEWCAVRVTNSRTWSEFAQTRKGYNNC